MTNKYSYINLDYLHEVADGDQEFMQDMMQEYLDKIPAYIDDLVNAGKAHNMEQVVFCAHKLKSSFQLMGVKQLATIAQQIEQYCKENSHQDEISGMIEQIPPVFEQAVAELKQELAKNNL